MSNIIRKILSISLIAILLINSSALIVISDAIDEIQLLTNNKNVQFSAYFKDENGNKITEIDKEINSSEMKIFIELSVKQEGYLENGTIELTDSNFKFDTQNEVAGVEKIEENKVTVSYIGAGETKELELKINAIKDDSFDLHLLDKQTVIKFKGNYVSSQNSNNTIESTREVKLNLISPYNQENTGIKVSQEIITNTVTKYNGENKRIIQLAINYGLEGTNYPIKSTKLQLNAPKINGNNPQNVIVNSTNKSLTTKEELTEENYSYDKENGTLEIKADNPIIDNKVEWNKDKEDKYIVTYIFDNIDELEEQTLKTNLKIDLYDKQNTILTSENEILLKSETRNQMISLIIENTENEIYKGKLYANGEREFVENIYLNINCIGVSNSIEISEKQEENLYTKQVKINKQNLIDILGEDGSLSVANLQSKQVLSEVNKNTRCR